MQTLPCVQCGRPGVASVQGRNLCIDHATAWQNAVNGQQAQTLAVMNMLGAQIDDIMGVPRRPAFEAPAPQIHQGGNYTVHQVNVDRSIVGTINTSQVDQIQTSMSHLSNGGPEEQLVKEALSQLTDAVVASSAITSDLRKEVIEHLAFLSNQASMPQKDRQTSIIKSVLKSVGSALNTLSDVTTIWNTASPIVASYLLSVSSSG